MVSYASTPPSHTDAFDCGLERLELCTVRKASPGIDLLPLAFNRICFTSNPRTDIYRPEFLATQSLNLGSRLSSPSIGGKRPPMYPHACPRFQIEMDPESILRRRVQMTSQECLVQLDVEQAFDK
jgi:hypothetical protein